MNVRIMLSAIVSAYLSVLTAGSLAAPSDTSQSKTSVSWGRTVKGLSAGLSGGPVFADSDKIRLTVHFRCEGSAPVEVNAGESWMLELTQNDEGRQFAAGMEADPQQTNKTLTIHTGETNSIVFRKSTVETFPAGRYVARLRNGPIGTGSVNIEIKSGPKPEPAPKQPTPDKDGKYRLRGEVVVTRDGHTWEVIMVTLKMPDGQKFRLTMSEQVAKLAELEREQRQSVQIEGRLVPNQEETDGTKRLDVTKFSVLREGSGPK